MPEADKIILNRDLSEEISVVLREIYKKIKKKGKFKNYDELKKKVQEYMDNLYKDDILDEFRVRSSSNILENENNNVENDNNNPEAESFVYEYKTSDI